jgi:hypothetical protein
MIAWKFIIFPLRRTIPRVITGGWLLVDFPACTTFENTP